MKKLVLGIVSLGLMTIATYAASNASDNASNAAYAGPSWNNGSNGGSGFGAWAFTNSGGAGEYNGASGDGASPTWGMFAGNTTDQALAVRPFTGNLAAGQTFSVSVGEGPPITAGGDVGFNLLSGTTPEFTFKANSNAAGSFWQLNDGGSDFATTIPVTDNTPVNFNLTFNGGTSYSLSITEGSTTYTANGFNATNPINALNGVQFFSNKQGGGGNLGINNLAITTAVPEPGTILSFLSGSSLLGAMMYIRRRRA